MTPEEEQSQLDSAIALAQSGQKEKARQAFQAIIRENPRSEIAWMWFVEMLPPHQRIPALKECLRFNPESATAKEGIAYLEQQPESSTPILPPHSAAKANKEEPVPAPPPPPNSGTSTRGFAGPISCGCLGAIAVVVFLIPAIWFFLPAFSGKNPIGAAPTQWAELRMPVTLPFLHAPNTATATRTTIPTETPTIKPTSSPTGTASASPTKPMPQVTQTRTKKPTETQTSTIPPTPTLYFGTPEASEAQILFFKKDTCAVFAVPLSGGETQLTMNAPEGCLYAQIAPNGKKLGFVNPNGENILRSINVDGTGGKNILTISPFEGLARTFWGFKWSATGSKIAYISPAFGYGDDGNPFVVEDAMGWLSVISSEGAGTPKRIQNVGVWKNDIEKMSWSPDSQWIYLLDGRAMGDGAENWPYVYRVSDSKYIQVAYMDSTPFADRFDWAPDSGAMSHLHLYKPGGYGCASEDAPYPQNYLILTSIRTPGKEPDRKCFPLLGTFENNETGDLSTKFGALWSPDGKRFLMFNTKLNSLVILEEDKTTFTPVLTTSGVPLFADWSPDGKWIYFVRQDGILEIVRTDGSDRRTLAYNVDPSSIVWQ